MTIRSQASRRQFLRWSGGLSVLGASAGPLALQLAATGAAATAAPDYKALVCVFLLGGQDSNNAVLATDADSWGRYTTARNTGQDPINLMPVGTPAVANTTGGPANKPKYWGGVLPFTPRTPQLIPAGTKASTRTFALHPMLAPLLPLYTQGRLAVLANVGPLIQPTTKAQFTAGSVPIPAELGSHNDQQNTWQAGAIEGARLGWGGQMGDMLAGLNGTEAIFTAISAYGNAVFLAGNSVVQYVVNAGGGNPAVPIQDLVGLNFAGWDLFGSPKGIQALNSIVLNQNEQSLFAQDYAAVVQRSVNAASTINNATSTGAAANTPAIPDYTNPVLGVGEDNPLAEQLYTVAKIIAAAPSLGVRRQVFFTAIGGFDTHDTQNVLEPNNLAKVAQGLAYFDALMSNVGGVDLRANVTTFTMSDFSRTFTSNGAGTDHGWGGHHFILGGAVKGGDMYGQYPTLGVDLPGFTNPDMAGNNMVPTTSVDQYAATLGRWFGVADADLHTIFPNLQNYATPYLGFI
jgi:uncharacterized protein (DUF1501 family)